MKIDTNFKADLSQDLYFIRGVAIVFVVVGHVIGFNREYGMRQVYNSDLSVLGWVCDLINTFHMPIFFMASGIAFAIFSNKDTGYVKFVQSKLKKLLIPLICWSPIYFVFQSLSKSRAFSLIDIINSIIYPYEIFWFLHALVFATLLSFICFKLIKMPTVYFGLSISLFIVCLFLENSLIYMYLHWNIFYAFGVFIAAYLSKISLILKRLSLPILLVVGCSGLLVMLASRYFLEFDKVDLVRLINGPTAFLLMYLILNSGKRIILPMTASKLTTSFTKHVVYLGKLSMVIYLFHGYFTRSTIIFLLKVFGRPEPSLYFILVCSMGILGSVILYKLLENRSKIFIYSIGGGK